MTPDKARNVITLDTPDDASAASKFALEYFRSTSDSGMSYYAIVRPGKQFPIELRRAQTTTILKGLEIVRKMPEDKLLVAYGATVLAASQTWLEAYEAGMQINAPYELDTTVASTLDTLLANNSSKEVLTQPHETVC